VPLVRRVLIVVLLLVVVVLGVRRWQERPPAYATCSTSEVGDPVQVTEGEPLVGVDVEAVAEVPQATSVHPMDDGRLFVTTQGGQLYRVDPDGRAGGDDEDALAGGNDPDGEPELVLDLADRVADGFEQGLLSVVVSEQHEELYLYYTATDNDTQVIALAYRDGEVDVDDERLVLEVEQPKNTHNGGQMLLDDDGLLWISLGDGGAGAQADQRDLGFAEQAQNLDSLLGSILRIDPEPSEDRGYSVPADNPFVGVEGARDEIWAYGLRNPWRFSLDRETGDLWIGDVGQWCWEEINHLPAAEGAGANLGWPAFEGRHRYRTDPPDEHVLPVVAISPDDLDGMVCAVTGGFVYRGSAIPELQGAYVYGDACAPQVRALVRDGAGWTVRSVGPEVPALVSFGEDADGELYTVSLATGVGRLVPSAP
jgi:glucose/arabinose dehydrogenase